MGLTTPVEHELSQKINIIKETSKIAQSKIQPKLNLSKNRPELCL